MAQKVFVGMSGGVDSSVAAALLVEQGYDVTGIYMKNWSQDLPGMQCPWAEDLADAKRVAVQLGIDFKVFDFERDYKQKVVDYMLEEYKLGRTPNPDVMCNQEVKFKLFLEACLEQGADLIATGHYARVAKSEASGSISSLEDSAFPAERGQERQLNQLAAERPERVDGASAALANDCSGDLEKESGTRNSQPRFFSRPPLASSAELIRAKDSSKDQTYFLYRVTGETLGRTIFPLGDYTKDEVREMAKERGLWTASKKESMGICFVGQVGIREFLSQYVKTRPGDIIDKQTSKVVGRHDGAIFYTLGQRHGLNIGGGLPYYVVGKDMDKNQIFVSRSLNDESLWREKILLSNEHWINQPPKNGTKIQVRLRHRGALIDAIYSASTLHLASAERAVAPGQSAVVYDGEVCLGGGIVKTD